MGAKCRVNLGVAEPGQSVKLFVIYNTSHNGLYVLAQDWNTAISIAHSANHIHWIWDRKDRTYPHAEEVRSPRGQQMSESWHLIELAIARRQQGTVHLDGPLVLVGNEVVK